MSSKKFSVVARQTNFPRVEALELRQLLSFAALDPGFGNNGVVAGMGGAAKVLSDGKILVDVNNTIKRLNANGSIDSTFNPAGVTDDWEVGRARQSDGKLLILSNNTLTRYNTDGSIDTTFGTAGKVTSFAVGHDLVKPNDTIAPGNVNFVPMDIALRGNQILLGGGAYPTDFTQTFGLERLNLNGSLDTTYGLHVVPGPIGNAFVDKFGHVRIQIGADGTAYVMGDVPESDNLYIAKFSPPGATAPPDTVKQISFGTGFLWAGDMAMQPDGKLLLTGLISEGVRTRPPFVVRLNSSDLSVDPTLGGPDGLVLTQYDWVDSTVTSTSDGKVLFSVGGDLLRILPKAPPIPGGTLSGYLYNDLNGDGKRSPNEPALGGWQVYLDTNNNGYPDPGEPVATADANGFYTIAAPAWGQIRELRHDAWVRTDPPGAWPDGGVLTFQTDDYRPDLFATFANFGNYPGGVISGTVYKDANGDGYLQSGETGAAGWQVYLDSNNNGKFDAGENAVRTDSSGHFGFSALPVGNYIVRVTSQAGWKQNYPAAAWSFSLGIGQARNLSFLEAPPATIQGTVYNDVNGSKTRDAGDLPMAGVKFYLDLNANGIFDAGEPTAVSDSTGTYRFTGLVTRSYGVAQIVPSGYRQVVPGAPYGQRIYAPPGQTAIVAPFLDHRNTGVLSGVVYKDLNFSGLQSPGEPGLAGIRVYLDLNKDGVWEGNEPSVLSSANGSYQFTNLAPGTYTLRIVTPSGWKITGPYAKAYTRTLNSDYTIGGNDFGLMPLTTSLLRQAGAGN